MLRKAVVGLIGCGAVIAAVLFLLGFRPSDLVRFFEKPYEQALRDGDYLQGLRVQVPGRTVSGTLILRLTFRNPTPSPLAFVGEWENMPAGCRMEPSWLSVSVPPRGAVEKEVRMELDEGRAVSVTAFAPPALKGEWRWLPVEVLLAGKKVERGKEVRIPFERRLVVQCAFGRLNWGVLGGYLAAMLIIGMLCGRGIRTTRGFFVADGKLHYLVVGLSILGTYLSALTMMGLPGMSYGEHDWTYMVQLPCLILTAMIITGLVLPRYRAAGIVSVYEYLERRIHVSARLVGSVCFILFAIGRMGLVLYLPALAFSTVTGTPLWLAIVLMGVVITVYTVVGGMKAVVWTDAIQVVIFIAGALLTLVFIFRDLGVDAFFDIAVEHHKFRTIIPDFDPRKIVTLWLVLETIFQTVRIYGTQQDMTQRYLTTPSTEDANRSVWIAILSYIPLGFLFYFLGTALFAFYRAHPTANLPGKADPMYPHFVMHYMPAGLAGLVIAAIFAAAMSSIDSAMNSASTVCVEDFWKRFLRRGRSEEEYLVTARRLTVLWGIAAILMALAFMKIRYAQIVWGKVMGISTNGMLGLMALAFLPFPVSKWAAGAGIVVSYAALFLMMGTGVNFLLWPVVGNLACFFVGLLSNPLFLAAERCLAERRKRAEGASAA